MATPEVVEANGLPESSSPSHSESRASSISLPAKRKRDDDDAVEGEATAVNGTGDHGVVKEATPEPLGPPSPESLQKVRDFVLVLRRYVPRCKPVALDASVLFRLHRNCLVDNLMFSFSNSAVQSRYEAIPPRLRFAYRNDRCTSLKEPKDHTGRTKAR